MARRNKSSPAEDWVELIAMLPWWAGCALALVSYLFLHRIAAQENPLNMAPGQITQAMTQTVWKTLAGIGQYLVPLLCLGGAAVCAYRRSQRKDLITEVASSKAADVLDAISWQEFEILVGEAYRLQGYQVIEIGAGGADGGVDLVLRKGGEKFFVQCKQWKAFTVGVTVVRELYGVMAAKGAAGGFVVTSGRFTDEAKAFASGRNVKLIDGPLLHGLIKTAMAGAGSKATALPTNAATAPTCPVCAKAMMQRTAKRESGGKPGAEQYAAHFVTGLPNCGGHGSDQVRRRNLPASRLDSSPAS